MTRLTLTLAAALSTAVVLPAQTVAVVGARVYPVSSAPIDNATVIVRDGRVVAVGAQLSIPAGATRIEAAGKWITPGIFNATTSLGLTEIGAVQETNDGAARGRNDGVTASFAAWQGFNPASAWLQTTKNDGITTVGVVPNGGLIAGQGAVVSLGRGTVRDMTLRAPAAMFGDLNARGDGIGASRGEVFQRMRDVLSDAKSYPQQRASYERNQLRPLAARPADLEALQPVLRGALPMVLDADRATDIQSALGIAAEFGLKLAVSSATEGWKVAEELGRAKAFVLVGALSNLPRNFSMLGARQDNAALLSAAGARVIIAGGADAFNARNVRYEAGVAVSFGMPWDAALRAVTLTPAELFGVATRVGSLESGKDATFVVWSGDPFEPSTRAERVFVQGIEVQGPSRQDELMRRYKQFPVDYRRP